MRKILGWLLVILGIGGGGYIVLVGIGFSSIYLMGFLGTGGNEGGDELGFMLLLTLVTAVIAWGLTRLGLWLLKSRGRDEPSNGVTP